MRQETIVQLQRHLNAVLSKRRGQVVGVWGEAGIGKSHTLAALLRDTPCRHLIVQSGPSNAQIALSLPRSQTLPTWARTHLKHLERGDTVDAATLIDLVAVMLAALAPFVVLFEDAHEANAERWNLLRKLAEVVPRVRGVGVIASSRAELPDAFASYRLEALEDCAAHALLETEARGVLPKEGSDWVQARAGGNPLFSLEFWRYLLRQGAFWFDGLRWQWREPASDFVPVSIEALISDVLASQTDSCARTVLEVRALLELNAPPGRSDAQLDETVWAQVVGVSVADLRVQARQLESRGLLIGAGFAHPLFREVLIGETPAERWRAHARRAVEVLEAAHPERAAAFVSAAELGDEAASHLLETARCAAEHRGDAVLASALLVRLVAYLGEPERGVRALQAAQHIAPFDLTQAEQLAQIAALAPEPPLEAVLLHAELLARQGQMTRATDLLKTLVAQPSRATGQPKIHSLEHWQTLVYVTQLEGRFEEVVALWDTHPDFSERADTFTKSHVAFSLLQLGRIAQATAFIAQMAQRHSGDLRGLYYLHNVQAMALRKQDLSPQALAAADQTVAVARQLGWPGLLAQSLRNYAVCARQMNHLAQAREKLREALTLYHKTGNLRTVATAQDSLASILFDEGRFEEAETLFRQVQSVLVLNGLKPAQCDNHLDQAVLYLDWQPTSGVPLALRHAHSGLELARAMDSVIFLARGLGVCAQAQAHSGHADHAMRLALELRALAQEHPSETNRSLLALGAALEAAGRLEEARAAYQGSHDAYLEHGFDGNADRAGLEADRLSGDLECARQRHARFVAQGLLGNARVAERYFPQLSAVPAKAIDSSLISVPSEPVAVVRLHLNVLGLPQLERDGHALVYRSKKRLELLCYLLEARIAGKTEVSALELAEVFYPDTADRDAKHTLRQQIYLIRADLGTQCVHSTTNGYALEAITSDAEQFLKTRDTQLWRGAYLERASEGWDGNVRDCLVQALRSRLEQLGQRDPPEAARVSRILIEMEPYDRDLLRRALQLHALSSETNTVERLYAAARERFWSVNEALPPSAQAFMRESKSPRAVTDF